MLVCDLSSMNRKISLGLKLRKVSQKPVVIIKDKTTPNIFYIDTCKCVEYLESYESDDVQNTSKKILKSLCKVKRCEH